MIRPQIRWGWDGSLPSPVASRGGAKINPAFWRENRRLIYCRSENAVCRRSTASATTERDNVKATADNERRFVLAEHGEEVGLLLEVDQLLEQFKLPNEGFTPVQDQFFDKIVKTEKKGGTEPDVSRSAKIEIESEDAPDASAPPAVESEEPIDPVL